MINNVMGQPVEKHKGRMKKVSFCQYCGLEIRTGASLCSKHARLYHMVTGRAKYREAKGKVLICDIKDEIDELEARLYVHRLKRSVSRIDAAQEIKGLKD